MPSRAWPSRQGVRGTESAGSLAVWQAGGAAQAAAPSEVGAEQTRLPHQHPHHVDVAAAQQLLQSKDAPRRSRHLRAQAACRRCNSAELGAAHRRLLVRKGAMRGGGPSAGTAVQGWHPLRWQPVRQGVGRWAAQQHPTGETTGWRQGGTAIGRDLGRPRPRRTAARLRGGGGRRRTSGLPSLPGPRNHAALRDGSSSSSYPSSPPASCCRLPAAATSRLPAPRQEATTACDMHTGAYHRRAGAPHHTGRRGQLQSHSASPHLRCSSSTTPRASQNWSSSCAASAVLLPLARHGRSCRRCRCRRLVLPLAHRGAETLM